MKLKVARVFQTYCHLLDKNVKKLIKLFFRRKFPRTLNIEETLNSGYQAVKFEVSAFTIKLQTMDF